MSLMTRGALAFIRRQKAACGRAINYTRDGIVYQFVAWPGSQMVARTPTATNGATAVRAEAVYLFAIADAVAAGVAMPPKRGDRLSDPTVKDERTGAAKAYEVQAPAGDREWRYQDHDDFVARVVCQRAGNA